VLIIDLIRHVKVNGNAALYGKTDIAPSLNDNQQLVNQLINRESYDVVISSPLQRCWLLAEQLANTLNKPLFCLEALQEIDFGIYDGIAFNDIPLNDGVQVSEGPVNWPSLEAFFQAPARESLPRAESLSDFNQRVITCWYDLLDRQYQLPSDEKLHHNKGSVQPKRIAIVAHGGIIRMILAEVLGLDWKNPLWHQNLKIANGSLTTLTISQPFKERCWLQQVNNIAIPLLV